MTSGANSMRLITATVTLICWILTVYKARDLVRDPRNASLRALWLAIAAITLAMTIQPIAHRIDAAVGVLDAGRVTANCLTLLSGAGAQACLLYLTEDEDGARPKVRRRYTFVLAGILALVGLFVIAPKPYEPTDSYVMSGQYANSGYTAPYTYLYIGLLAWPLLECGTLAVHSSAIATRPLLRFGLRLITAGTMLGMAYLTLKLVQGVLQPSGSVDQIVDIATVVCFSSSTLIILVGSTLPSWGERIGLGQAWETVTAVVAYRQLTPLWTAMHRVNPHIALFTEPVGFLGLLQVARQARLRLVRRVVEINDGLVELYPYTRRRVASAARERTVARKSDESSHDALVVARVITDAIDRYADGLDPTPEDERYPLAERPADDDDATGTELKWLIELSRAYSRRVTAEPTSVSTRPVAAHIRRRGGT